MRSYWFGDRVRCMRGTGRHGTVVGRRDGARVIRVLWDGDPRGNGQSVRVDDLAPSSLTEPKRRQAVRAGAVELDRAGLVALIDRRRDTWHAVLAPAEPHHHREGGDRS